MRFISWPFPCLRWNGSPWIQKGQIGNVAAQNNSSQQLFQQSKNMLFGKTSGQLHSYVASLPCYKNSGHIP